MQASASCKVSKYLTENLKLIVNETKSKVVELPKRLPRFRIVRKGVMDWEEPEEVQRNQAITTDARTLAKTVIAELKRLPSRSGELLCDRDQVWRDP